MAGDTTTYDGTPRGIGDLLELIRDGRARTRADVAALTGWGRGTVSERLEMLSTAGLIRAAGELASTGGRPAAVFEFNADAGIVLAAEVGATHVRAAITDLNAEVLGDVHAETDAAHGPERVLGVVNERFRELLGQSGRRPPMCSAWASASPLRSSSPPGGRSTRRSCPAGIALKSALGWASDGRCPRSSTTRST